MIKSKQQRIHHWPRPLPFAAFFYLAVAKTTRYQTLRGVAAILLFITGCGGYDDGIAMQEYLKERQLKSPTIVPPKVPVPVTEWSGKTNAMIAPGVYGLGGLSPSAAYAIETEDGVILIDTGLDEQALRLRECLLEVGLAIEDVRHVLLTHAHYDHVFGANRVRESSGATVCAGADDVEVLENANEFALFSLFPRVDYSGTPIQIDRALQDGDTIELGDTTVQAIGCPGHTPGSMCYRIERTEEEGGSILFSGDVIASMRFGPATYPIFISPRYRGDAESYLQTIDRLIAMKVPDLLLSGHPRQQMFARGMSIDAAKWQELLLPARREIQTALQRYQSDGKDFLDGTPKQIEQGLFYFGEIDNVAVYGIRNEEQWTVVNAPGGERFLETLRDRFETLGLEFREPVAVLLTTNEESGCSGLVDVAATTLVMSPGRLPPSLESTAWPPLDQESLNELVSTTVEIVPIGSPNVFAIAYEFQRGGKQILITPSAPRSIRLQWVTRKTGGTIQTLIQPQTSDLVKFVESSQQERDRYLETLDALSNSRPDVWLPSLPLAGQNANLYDESWNETIRSNRDLVEP